MVSTVAVVGTVAMAASGSDCSRDGGNGGVVMLIVTILVVLATSGDAGYGCGSDDSDGSCRVVGM